MNTLFASATGNLRPRVPPRDIKGGEPKPVLGTYDGMEIPALLALTEM